MKRVFVGLSGGVDSSVAALLLKQQGFRVTGVYMKNWTQDLPGAPCPWKDDFADAKRVAVQLGVDFIVYDFQNQYRQKVVDQMLKQYKLGVTPNPDITCNQEIKFKLFLETALSDGAQAIATGHYANVKDGKLLEAKDKSKDQTYFLYRVDGQALKNVIFPLGGLMKTEVREIAKKNNLVTAEKKESMGICFVGKANLKDFLTAYNHQGQTLKKKAGSIVDQSGLVVGEHDGAVFYTIGQRHGLNIGGGLPYYVVGKSISKNEVYVSNDLQDEKLWADKICFTSAHWLAPKSDLKVERSKLTVRTRHQAKMIPVKSIVKLSDSQWKADLTEEVRALAPGQSAVFYANKVVLGGGIIV